MMPAPAAGRTNRPAVPMFTARPMAQPLPTPPRAPCVVAALIALAAALPALAQPIAPRVSPRHDPALNDPSIDDVELEQQRPRDADLTVTPTPPRPGQRAVPSIAPPVLPGVILSVPGRRVYAEGTFFAARRGSVARFATGDIVFIPSPPANDGVPPDPAMLLQPSAKLTQLLTALSGDVAEVSISGQVFVYRGRHHLLVTAFSISAADETVPTDPAATPTIPPATSPPTSPTTPDTNQDANPDANQDANPGVDELIKALEGDRGPRAIDPSPSTKPEGAAPGTLLAEGTVLIARSGRLVRPVDVNGRICFSFDNDPDSPTPPPILIAPCRMLEQMEALTYLRGESTALRMSGRILVFKGRNYLLPTMFQAVRTGDIAPLQ
jgi:hypothetical protein